MANKRMAFKQECTAKMQMSHNSSNSCRMWPSVTSARGSPRWENFNSQPISINSLRLGSLYERRVLLISLCTVKVQTTLLRFVADLLCNKLYNLLYNKSATNRSNGVCAFFEP